MYPFHTCKAGLTAGSQLRLRLHTQKLFVELDSPVSCGTGSLTGTQHQALGCHNKPRARIVSCAHPRTVFSDCVTPPPPHLRTTHVISKATDGEKQLRHTEEIFCSKNEGYRRIKQGLDGNLTKKGSPKVTDIDYNTVEPFIF